MKTSRSNHIRRESAINFDGYVFGSPTYLCGVTSQFKAFMDSTGRMWRSQQLKGKLAAGFTVSSLPAGDKQSTLLSMFVFCMQHGLLWVGNPVLPEQHSGVPYDEAANRLGSWSGLMAQAAHGAPAGSFPAGDIKTARMFGKHFGETLHRLEDVSVRPAKGSWHDPREVWPGSIWRDPLRTDVAASVRYFDVPYYRHDTRFSEQLGSPVANRLADCVSGRRAGRATDKKNCAIADCAGPNQGYLTWSRRIRSSCSLLPRACKDRGRGG